jgi:hypothetical protein
MNLARMPLRKMSVADVVLLLYTRHKSTKKDNSPHINDDFWKLNYRPGGYASFRPFRSFRGHVLLMPDFGVTGG